MKKPCRLLSVSITLALGLVVLPPTAQGAGSSSGSARLFLSFIEDAVIVDSQRWEGQLDLADGDLVDTTIVRGVAAFHLRESLEVGGSVGFGSSDSSGSLPDGSGATDMDLWAKYGFGSDGGRTEFAAGGIVTIPTGDDTSGLGFDAFSVGGFGALRHRLQRGIITAQGGLRLNGDGMLRGGAEVEGETSFGLGFGFIYPRSDRVTLIGELKFEEERFEVGDPNTRVLGGVNWRLANQGMFRGAVALGIDDGAPDAQLIVGYAHHF